MSKHILHEYVKTENEIGSYIGDEGAKMISEALRTENGIFRRKVKGNTTLISLNLSGNR